MTSDQLRELLDQAVEKIAELEDFPPDWKNWAYWDKEKKRRWDNEFPSPHHLTPHIEGERRVGETFVDLLIPRVFDSHGDPRDHPLWELTLRVTQHPRLKDSDKEQFLLHCSRENLYLKTFSFEFFFLENPDDGKVVEGEISVPENTEQTARERAKQFLDSESDRLAERFGFQRPHFFDLQEISGSGWTAEPKKNAAVRILSADRVE